MENKSQFKMLLRFGKRDFPRYKKVEEILKSIPEGHRTQIVKELLLFGINNSNIVETFMNAEEFNEYERKIEKESSKNINNEVEKNKKDYPEQLKNIF